MGVVVPAKGRHFCVPDGFIDESWKKFDKILVDTDEKFYDLVSRLKVDRPPAIAFDTETTGKDFNKDTIVGCSLAWKLDSGYYIPFGHQVGDSLDLEKFGELWDAMYGVVSIIPAYNKRFDYRIVRKTLHSINRQCPEPFLSKFFEVAAITWNVDTDRWGKRSRLKVMAKDFLGWDLDTFEQTLGEVENMSLRTPGEVVQYAVLDVLIVLHLMKKFRNIWEGRKVVVDLDDRMTTALIDIEDEPHELDLDFCQYAYDKNAKDAEERLQDVKTAIVDRLIELSRNKVYLETPEERYAWARIELMKSQAVNLDTLNLNSAPVMNKVLGKALGVDTGTYTDTGAISFSAKALDALELAGAKVDPVLKKVIKYRQSVKNMGYLKKFLDEGKSGRIRCAYNTTRVTTGRLSASGSEGNSYFYSASVHTVKKAKKAMFLAVPGTQILGYDFLELRNEGTKKEPIWVTSEGLLVGKDVHGTIVEGYARDHTNVRRALCAKPGHYYVHVDYNAEEVRLLGNLTGDRSLIRTFNETNIDVHSQTVIDLFGSFIPEKRQIAKGINFLSSYGGSAFSLAAKVGISKTEAEMYLNKWWRVRSGVRVWKQEMLDRAIKTGFVETAFGRIRWVDYCLLSRDPRQKSLGERLCLNSPIQGTAGDMLRLVIARIHKNIWRQNRGDFQIASTVHDEVNFSIKKERAVELALAVAKEMDILLPSWKIRMTADFEIGTSWGEVYKFVIPEDGTAPYPVGEAA